MYSTKIINKNVVDGNAYITINDPYRDEVPNPFRNTKRGKDEKPLVPFQVKVGLLHVLVVYFVVIIFH